MTEKPNIKPNLKSVAVSLSRMLYARAPRSHVPPVPLAEVARGSRRLAAARSGRAHLRCSLRAAAARPAQIKGGRCLHNSGRAVGRQPETIRPAAGGPPRRAHRLQTARHGSGERRDAGRGRTPRPRADLPATALPPCLIAALGHADVRAGWDRRNTARLRKNRTAFKRSRYFVKRCYVFWRKAQKSYINFDNHFVLHKFLSWLSNHRYMPY